MSTKLFIGNLSWGATDDMLRDAFGAYGELEDVFIMKDRATGRSKGFAFVTFANEDDAHKAVEALNGSEIDGREIVVDVAKPKREF